MNVTIKSKKASTSRAGLRRTSWAYSFVLTLLLVLLGQAQAQTERSLLRSISGVVMTDKNEVLPNVSVAAKYASGKKEAITDANGSFRLSVPDVPVTLRVLGKNVTSDAMSVAESGTSENVRLRANYAIPAVHESLVISATALNPPIDQRNENVYKRIRIQPARVTLFSPFETQTIPHLVRSEILPCQSDPGSAPSTDTSRAR